MATYKTPDVYVEEISIFPPSIAEVETAVPAFIGYTESTFYRGEDLKLKPTKIRSMVEFETIFGGAPNQDYTVTLDSDDIVTSVNKTANYYLYDSLKLYFDNGGGKCYIISVGVFPIAVAINDLKEGLKALRKADEPTMIVCPDAVALTTSADFYSYQQQALKQCGELMDRVAVLDLLETGDEAQWQTKVDEFRNNVGINYLKYGAAYTPWLKANLDTKIHYRDLTFKRGGANIKLIDMTSDTEIKQLITDLNNAIAAVNYLTNAEATTLTPDASKIKDQFMFYFDAFDTAYANYAVATNFEPLVMTALKSIYDYFTDVIYAIMKTFNDTLLVSTNFVLKNDITTSVTNYDLAAIYKKLVNYSNKLDVTEEIYDSSPPGGSEHEYLCDPLRFNVLPTDVSDATVDYSGDANAKARTLRAKNAAVSYYTSIIGFFNSILEAAENYEETFENSLPETFGTYKDFLTSITVKQSALPPSGAIAGVYSYVDSTRGVFKAPANVSLSSVTAPTVEIDFETQKDLNVDVNAGKSINAIRTFTGKGVLVWGARTLAGNDNEWRYISVRRFFNMVEESVKKSTYWAVFEPNDANTWIKVKSMIENYLILKWKEGALAGAKPEQAFFVQVGLGSTMTAQDILEGRMIVKIGMAVVRPAEFIILQFSHKMQES